MSIRQAAVAVENADGFRVLLIERRILISTLPVVTYMMAGGRRNSTHGIRSGERTLIGGAATTSRANSSTSF